MRLKVVVDERTFDVPCGAGGQSIKWLGNVASQRYALMKPCGRLRSRESESSDGAMLLPKDVIFENSSIDPDRTINEVFEDGAEVRVELMKEVTLDEIGAPAHTAWQQKAFWSDSNASRIRREGIESREKIKQAEQRIAEEIERRRREARRYKEEARNEVLLGHFEREEDSVVALELDWKSLEATLETLRCVPGPTSSAAFKEDLKANYKKLNSIYARYAGIGKIGDPNGLTLLDFSHIVHILGVACLTDLSDRDTIVRVFDKARGAGYLVTRAQFVAALVSLSLRKRTRFEEEEDPKRRPPSRRVCETPMRALELLIDEHLTPLLEKRRSDPCLSVFDAVHIQDAIHQARPVIYQIYETFAALPREPDDDDDDDESFIIHKDDGDDDGQQQQQQHREDRAHHHHHPDSGATRCVEDVVVGRGMTLKQLTKLLKDCGLVALFYLDAEASKLLSKTTENAFFDAQNDPIPKLQLSDLAFAEVIEAYARVAATMLESDDVSGKILLAIDRLSNYALNN